MASDPLVVAGMSTHAAVDHSAAAAGVEHMDCCQIIAVVVERREMERVLLLHPCRVKSKKSVHRSGHYAVKSNSSVTQK